jgi:Lar family restriction alleviation protein
MSDDQMSDMELLPCPFCGGEAILKCICNVSAHATDDWWVSCKNCRVERPSTKKTEIAGSREQAIASWNRRAGTWQPLPDDIYNTDAPSDLCEGSTSVDCWGDLCLSSRQYSAVPVGGGWI